MSYADTKPTIVSLPPIVAATQPATGVLGQVWINTTTNTVMFWDGAAWKAVAAAGGGGPDILGDESNVSMAGLAIQVDGGSLVYNQATNTWGMKKLMHSFPNKFKSALVADPAPVVGDIWGDKNTTPSTLKEWDGTAWTPINFGTTTIPFLSSLANVNVPRNGSFVDHGVSLVFNAKSDLWEDAHPSMFFKNWARAGLYASGEIVYYHNTFWECLKDRSEKVEPVAKDGTVYAYWVEDLDGTMVQKSATVPYALHVGTALGTAPTVPCPTGGTLIIINYIDDTHWEIWHNKKTVGPGPTFTVTAAWTKLVAAKQQVWHNLAAPSPSLIGSKADNFATLWIYDSAGLTGTATPVVAQSDWKPVRPEGYLASLSDVRAATATVGDILVHDAQGHWVATPKWVTAPANKTDPGTPGQMAYDSTHIFMCVATNTWIRFQADHAGGW